MQSERYTLVEYSEDVAKAGTVNAETIDRINIKVNIREKRFIKLPPFKIIINRENSNYILLVSLKVDVKMKFLP